MVERRVDIRVNDQISPSISPSLREIGKSALFADSAINRLNDAIKRVDATALTKLANASATVATARTREATAELRLQQVRSRAAADTERATVASQRLATAQQQTAAAAERTRAAAARADIAVAKQVASTVSLENAQLRNATAAQRLATEQERTAAANSRAVASGTRAQTATIQQSIASERLAGVRRREKVATEAATTATQAYTRAVGRSNKVSRQQLAQNQNLIFQLQDIFVSLASGQRPMTVAIQQGSQISTIFGPGRGLTGILKQAGQAVVQFTKPFLPLIAVLGAVASGFAILQNEILGTTSVDVQFFDVVKGTFIAIGDAITNVLIPAIQPLVPYFKAVYDAIVTSTKFTFNAIVGAFQFAADAIPIIWGRIPDLLGDIVITTVNNTIELLEMLINASIAGINKLASFTGIALEQASLGRIENRFAAAGDSVGSQLADAANTAFNRDFAGEAFEAIRDRSVEVAIKRIAEENEKSNKKLSVQEQLLKNIKQPLTDYREQTKALNNLLRQGAISAGEYSQALQQLSLVSSVRGLDQSIGGQIGRDAELQEVRNREQERLNIIQQAVEARILLEEDAAVRINAVRKQAANEAVNIELESQALILNTASNAFGQLADAAKDYAGEQSGIYRGLFAASKAFAIAESLIKIQQGIANAISLPFPQNLAAIGSVVAASANIVSSIQAVKLAEGGQVRGPGTGTSDSIPAYLSDQEFVVNAKATKANLPLLEAINNGSFSMERSRPTVQAAAPPTPVSRGQVIGASNNSQQAGGGTTVQIINNTGQPVTQQRSQGAGGQNVIKVVIGEVRKSMARGEFDNVLNSRTGGGGPRPKQL